VTLDSRLSSFSISCSGERPPISDRCDRSLSVSLSGCLWTAGEPVAENLDLTAAQKPAAGIVRARARPMLGEIWAALPIR